jgi:hypothetical protein
MTRSRPRGGLSGGTVPRRREGKAAESWDSAEATRNPVSNEPTNVEVE